MSLLERTLLQMLAGRMEERPASATEALRLLHSKVTAILDDDDDDVDARQDALASLARAQTPRIAELETTADQLRVDLLRVGLVGLRIRRRVARGRPLGASQRRDGRWHHTCLSSRSLHGNRARRGRWLHRAGLQRARVGL